MERIQPFLCVGNARFFPSNSTPESVRCFFFRLSWHTERGFSRLFPLSFSLNSHRNIHATPRPITVRKPKDTGKFAEKKGATRHHLQKASLSESRLSMGCSANHVVCKSKSSAPTTGVARLSGIN